MGKMKMGHDHREKKFMFTPKQERPSAGSPLPDFDAIAKEVMEKHADTFKRLAEVEAAERNKPLATMLPTPCLCEPKMAPSTIVEKHTETVLKEVSTVDQRARNHTKASRDELHKLIDRKHGLFNSVIEIERKQRKELAAKIATLEARKPEEKQVVIEKVTEKPTMPKLVYGLLALSLVLNVLVIILK